MIPRFTMRPLVTPPLGERTSTASGVAVAFGGEATLRTSGGYGQTSSAPLGKTVF
jgi:hypothetical protein